MTPTELKQQLSSIKEYIEEDLSDIEASLLIDKYALDDMLIGHPQLFAEVGIEFSTAGAYKDFVDKHVKEVYGKCYADVRLNALNSGTKLSEEGVRQAIAVSKEYRLATALQVKVTEKHEKLRALKEAMNARGYMLRDLASLYIAGYFSKDSVSSGPAQEVHADATRSKATRKPLIKPKSEV